MQKEKLIFSSDDLNIIKWYIYSSFYAHADLKINSGGIMTYGRELPISKYRKQKLNSRSSNTSELVGPDDMSAIIIFTKLFM